VIQTDKLFSECAKKFTYLMVASYLSDWCIIRRLFGERDVPANVISMFTKNCHKFLTGQIKWEDGN